MVGATHGDWCGSRAWPTKCPTCKIPVFFFMCNCGSRVFFDALGPPWPLHDCNTSWTKGLTRTVSASGAISVQLSPGVTVIRPASTFAVDPKALGGSAFLTKKQSVSHPIVTVVPDDDEAREVVGVLRELSKSANPHKAFGIAPGSLGEALMGPLAAMSFGRITVHAPTANHGHYESFTLWIPTALIEDQRIGKDMTVVLTARGFRVAKEWAWVVEVFHVMG